ncbi:hypothetical protein [Zooshikella sp. RANM57]|uniref:hypothetical protein n=1 Tax=Zooshikella sp. RANM57 TaxID=3425863 RepID=UPI003D6F768C
MQDGSNTMSGSESLDQLKEKLFKLKEKGHESISIDELINTLHDFDQGLSDVEMERFKASLQVWIENNRVQHEAQHAEDLEIFRSVITAGQSALKGLFIINGGAIVAVLAFLGRLSDKHPEFVPDFSDSLIYFALGLFFTAIAFCATYLSQHFYATVDHLNTSEDAKALNADGHKYGKWFQIAVIVLCMLALFIFGVGVLNAYLVFQDFGLYTLLNS